MVFVKCSDIPKVTWSTDVHESMKLYAIASQQHMLHGVEHIQHTTYICHAAPTHTMLQHTKSNVQCSAVRSWFNKGNKTGGMKLSPIFIYIKAKSDNLCTLPDCNWPLHKGACKCFFPGTPQGLVYSTLEFLVFFGI